MNPVTVATQSGAPDVEHSTLAEPAGAGAPSGIRWWLPVALAGTYAAVLVRELPTLIAHTWWSADSASAGFVAQLYRHPPAGQYIVLGNHGWYEALSFYLLTPGLPAHRLLWYGVPVFAWVITVALVGLSARRAFGRYPACLAVAGLLCLAPVGLSLVFQPTAHTNVVFHAAVLAGVSGWILPRIRTLALTVVLGVAVACGAFTALATTGDAIALVWAVLPFAAAVAVCAWYGPVVALGRTLAFALATLTTMLVVTVLFTAIMHGAGLRVDELAQEHMLLLGGTAVACAVYRMAAAAHERRSRARATEITPRLVHVVFWSTCLTAGLLTFLLSSVGAVDFRYLVGPLVAIAALLPVAAGRGRDWRIAVGAGLAVMAVVGLVRLATRPLPYLPGDRPLARQDIAAVTRFAHRYHATDGYAVYWDAVTITWHTQFAVDLHPVKRCGLFGDSYCPLYHADSFTAAYLPRAGLRTLFIADARFGSAPAASWGRPLATEHIGRLTLYAYRYDIADRFPKPPATEIRRVISG